jgi:2',3'-cyclic-nucleotide 2'-phosphodiesterase (5'-nucleotidase family)
MISYKFGNLVSIFTLVAFTLVACNSSDHENTKSLAPGDTVSISVLTTTDLHGWIFPWDYSTDTSEERYGLAKVATIVDSIRNKQPYTLLLDAGDWLQGNQFADYFSKDGYSVPYYPLLKVAEAMNFDAFVLGNHEFNFGIEYLNKRIEQTTIPVLGANIYHYETKESAYKPYLIKNVGGVNIGVIGLTTPGSAVWDRPRVQGRLDFGDGTEAASRFVPEVLSKGAEVIIILAHSGLESGSSFTTPGIPEENFGRSVLETVPGINLYVFGHSHRVTDNLNVMGPDSTIVPVIQAGRWGSHLGEAHFKITRDANGQIQILDVQTKAFNVESVKSDESLLQLAKPYHEMVRSYVNAELVSTSDEWSAEFARLEDSPIVDLIHQVQLEVTGAQLSVASAFNTNARFGPGVISRRDIAQIYPYENMLYKIELSGKQIREFLEFTSRYYSGVQHGEAIIRPGIPGYNFDTIQGLDYVIDLRRPLGQRITRLSYQGQSVKDDDAFTMAINSYRAEGGGGYEMLRGVNIIWQSEIPVRTYIEDYLSDKQTISTEDVFTDNWKLQL